MKLLGKRCYKCRVIVRYVDKNSTLSRHRWSNSNYLHFHSLGSARDTFGTCLTDMSTLFMCSSCFLSTISGEGQQSHVWINMLPTLDRLLWKLHERRRWKESNLKAGWQKKKAIGDSEGRKRTRSGKQRRDERRADSFEIHVARGRRYIFVVCIYI